MRVDRLIVMAREALRRWVVMAASVTDFLLSACFIWGFLLASFLRILNFVQTLYPSLFP